MNLTKYIDLVKSISEDLVKEAAACQIAELSKELFNKQVELKALIADLQEAQSRLDEYETPKKTTRSDFTTLSPEDLIGLPDEVISQLAISEGDRQEFMIIEILKERGGIMSLDHLIIGWFQKTKTTMDRHKMTAKLYRMAHKNLIYSVPNRKGIYSLWPLENNEEDLIDPMEGL